MQKVADNAKRIRQSPRYYHNAALAATDELDEHVVGSGGVEWVKGWQNERRRGTGQTHLSHDSDATRAPELPSVVDKAYAHGQKAEGSRRRLTLRRKSQRVAPPFPGTNGSDVRTHPLGGMRDGRAATGSLPGHETGFVDAEEGILRPSPMDQANVMCKSCRRPPRAQAGSCPVLQPSSSPSASRSAGQRLALRRKPQNDLRPENFRTYAAWRTPVHDASAKKVDTTQAKSANVFVEDLSQDVDLFFSGAREAKAGSSLSRDLVRIANHLLALSFDHGSLDDIRSLFLWKLAGNTLTSLDAQIIYHGLRKLKLRMDHEELLDFYSNMFRRRSFPRITRQQMLRLEMSVFLDALDWDLDITPQELAQTLLNPLVKMSGDGNAMQSVLEKCQTLLAAGDVQRATDFVLSVRSLCSETREFADLIDATLSATLEAGSLTCCARLLRLANGTLADDQLKKQYDRFLSTCDAQGAYGLIVDLFVTEIPTRRLASLGLSHKSYEIIAVACAKAEHMTKAIKLWFRISHRQVPGHMRERIVQSRSILRIKALWQSTRDLPTMQQILQDTRSWLDQHGNEYQRRALSLTELEIYISANQLDLALSTIARIHGTQPADSETVSMAAVLFAKKDAWKSLARLLTIAQKSKMMVFDAETARRFNNTIRLYARQHSAAETWKFVTAAVDDLGFSPNHATTEIMLESFVSHRSIDLIPKWLRYLRGLGHNFQLNTRVAAKLLARFYLDHRLSHVLMMWFCRYLALFAPSLGGPELVDLVKEAIGYDLRKKAGNDSAWRQSSAQVRLGLLRKAKDVVPSPGYRWNKQLYVQCSDVASNPQNAVESRAVGAPSVSIPGEGQPSSEANPLLKTPDTNKLREHEDSENGVMSRREESLEDANSQYLEALNADTQATLKNQESNNRALQASDIPETHSDHVDAAQFSDLRPTYETHDSRHETAIPDMSESINAGELSTTRPWHRRSERDMVLALSLGQYPKVLELYRSSLDAVGLPASPLVLEVAVEASLRLHRGDRADAESILSQARHAGMNITCAMGPLLIHQMYHLNAADKKEANNLRIGVIDYYRLNEENGWPVKHHVGITAANILIDNRRAHYGLNILDAMFQSEWAIRRPLDIVAMTVFLKGYAALRSMDGMSWVVETVLRQDMRIDQKFLDAMKDAVKCFAGRSVVRMHDVDARGSRAAAVLIAWTQQCYDRRAKQRLDAKILGRRLVACLAKCANEEKLAVGSAVRLELEDSLFGPRIRPLALPSPSASLEDGDSANVITAQPKPNYMERIRLRTARVIRAEQSLGRWGHRGIVLRAYDRKWVRQYRAFLRKDLLMPDGKLAAFRYRLADEPERSLAGKLRGRDGVELESGAGE